MSITPEEQAALERLRKRGIEWKADLKIAATIALRDHPADDEEPVTEDWLNAAIDRQSGELSYCRDKMGHHVIEIDTCVDIVTRGDVRRLCQALGIELTELYKEKEVR